VHGILNRNFC